MTQEQTQETFLNYLGQKVTKSKLLQVDYSSTCNALNVVLHAKARAKRGKGPSMSIGVIKNPRHALYLAKQICNLDDEFYWPDYGESDYTTIKRGLLIDVVKGEKSLLNFLAAARLEVKYLRVKKYDCEFYGV